MHFLFLDSIGTGEVILIVAVIVMLFGPEKLPEIARTFSSLIGSLTKASNDLKREILEPAKNEFTNPLTGLKEEFDSSIHKYEKDLKSTFDVNLNEDSMFHENESITHGDLDTDGDSKDKSETLPEVSKLETESSQQMVQENIPNESVVETNPLGSVSRDRRG